MKKRSKLILKLLKKQKEPPNYQEKKESRIIYHFCDFIGIEPVEYKFPDCLNELIKKIDQELDYFFSQVNADQWNGEAFDKFIDTICDLSIEDINQQKLRHKKAAIEIRELQETYFSKLNLMIMEINQKIQEIEKEL